MDIPGYKLLLQDFCQYCPDFEPKVESICCTRFGDSAARFCHNIHCVNQEKCARIAENIEKKVMENGG